MRIKLGRMVGNDPLDSTALMVGIILGAFDNGEFRPVSTVGMRVSSSGAGDVISGAASSGERPPGLKSPPLGEIAEWIWVVILAYDS